MPAKIPKGFEDAMERGERRRRVSREAMRRLENPENHVEASGLAISSITFQRASSGLK
jgi:hypothetical protein